MGEKINLISRRSSSRNNTVAGIKILIAIGLVVTGIVWSYVAVGGMTYSEGDRVGIITKFSHKGLMFKTWEGELNMGGFDQGVASVWGFSVTDPEVIEKIHKAQKSGGRWVLTYREQFWTQSWNGKTAYFVTDVQPPVN